MLDGERPLAGNAKVDGAESQLVSKKRHTG
jgi:hypothetical protein